MEETRGGEVLDELVVGLAKRSTDQLCGSQPLKTSEKVN